MIWVLYTRRTPFRWTRRSDSTAELFVHAALGIVLGAILATVVIGEYAFAGLFCISALSILAISWAKNRDD